MDLEAVFKVLLSKRGIIYRFSLLSTRSMKLLAGYWASKVGFEASLSEYSSNCFVAIYSTGPDCPKDVYHNGQIALHGGWFIVPSPRPLIFPYAHLFIDTVLMQYVIVA